MQALELLAGLLIVLVVVNDVFNTVILPRPAPARYRPAGILTRNSWRAWRAYAERQPTPERREQRFGMFAPAIVLALLTTWILMLIAGFGLMLHALAAEIAPVPDFGTALYFAAVSLLTIGYGDVVATAGPSRVVAIAAGAVGLGIVALTITYLFSLYASFQRREVLVVTLDGRAGAPPSGIVLLETCATFDEAEIRRIFDDWERWSAEVLESHLAYPILLFFRSTHDHESWVSALGALLDAATLMMTTIADGPAAQAKVMRAIGVHVIEDIARFLGYALLGAVPDGPGVERVEFDAARERLGAAGYRLVEAEAAWASFAALRAEYAGRLNVLARFLSVPPAQWIGDRSIVYHRPLARV